MKALVYHRPKKVSVDEVPDPTIEEPTDVVLAVRATTICGSDLHILNGFFPQLEPFVLGHEFLGTVEAVGKDVRRLKRGDRVVVPFPISCGGCFFCSHAMPTHCERSNPDKYGPEGALMDQKGGGLFGYTKFYGGYDGGQAEYVRVPFADVGPRIVPEELSDEQALFLSDILPTGWTGVDLAGVRGGETVAVFGCGPVGLMAQKSAWIRGASRVFGLDILEYRRRMAERCAKAETIDSSDLDRAVEVLRELTDGRGPDVCIDAVGMEADRSAFEKVKAAVHVERGTTKVLRACFSAVRRGGTVTCLGVYGTPYDNFPLHQMFDKGIRFWGGQAPAHNYIDELIELVRQGRIVTDDIITHRMPLAEASAAYELFNDKKEDCVKVVLRP